MRRRPRFVHYVLSDYQNRTWLRTLAGSIERVTRGVYYARVNSDGPLPTRPGVRFFTVEGGKLAVTNHPLYSHWIGRQFDRRHVPCR